MPELSNLIRQRLGATKAPVTHPDADLISAYAEGGLQAHERAELTRHLAVCAGCRELLALSLPEAAVAPEPGLALRARARFSNSYLRIAASLAMILIVALLLLKRPHQQVSPAESALNDVAQNSPQRVPAVTNEAVPTTVTPPNFAASTEERAPVAPQRRMARVREEAPSQEARVTKIRPAAQTVEVANAAISQDYINSQMLAHQLFLTDQAQRPVQDLPSAPAPALTRDQKKMFMAGGVAGGDFSGIPFESIQRQTQTTSAVSIFRDPSHHGFSIAGTISRVGNELRLKRPMVQITPQNANRYAMFKPVPEGSAGAEIASTASSAENLKQSPAFTGLAMAPAARAHSQMFLWRIVQGKLLKSSDMSNWIEAYPATEGVDFTVVRSAGPDVWAGGNNAALVHSTDSGATWQRIVLGASATGAITNIEVGGNGTNVQVTSSSGQSWASQDGGRTWMMAN